MRRTKPVRIFIVDPDLRYAEGLAAQFASAFGDDRVQLEIFSEETRCIEKGRNPSLVVLGLSQGEAASAGLSSLTRLKKRFSCNVILLPSDSDGDTIRSARLSGVSDCFVKSKLTSKLLVEKVAALHSHALRPRPQGLFQLPIMMTPGALFALVLTTFLGCWMYFNLA